ncbi:enolase C-terminal domain-like protein [Verrucomicrobium sp. BvORR106]|uniref:enolase C-terminal domain-like protein n=1 Tax=Verrucomicrobium sp. BvORR106 TaxID=1403819 RepID=UPI0005714BB3|nr:enolase C-terminal domain-like protein [Verrucomicrobium sp. BvORR106]
MPMLPTDVRIVSAQVYFLPVTLRVPLKFGPETTTSVVCLRTAVTVRDEAGKTAQGWGETPLSVSWTWPSTATTVADRGRRMKEFSLILGEKLAAFEQWGHPLEIGYDFQKLALMPAVAEHNTKEGGEPMPYLAALVCLSAFDIALHDAYGKLHERDIYDCYGPEHVSRDLSEFLEPAEKSGVSFKGRFVQDFLVRPAPTKLAVWHLVGGLDPLETADLTGSEPNDGHPVTLLDWIAQDGLTCLKVKLRGTDARWDYERLLRVGRLGLANGMRWMSADFNCTVAEPDYVNEILDRLLRDEPEIYARTLYVEQPFAYELEHDMLDVRSVSARKPLFLDESAHDWEFVKLGRSLGWSGVALKTCKTQTGALLSLCWAKAHGMPLMVQDLTNPMLAILPHVRLAAHAGTIQGVECNAMQFYPDASLPEAAVHPGIYARRGGVLDLSTLGGPGMGYGLEKMVRELPESSS